MFRKQVIEPAYLSEREKIEFVARMVPGEVFPTAFSVDNELTLIGMLARRVIELERKVNRG